MRINHTTPALILSLAGALFGASCIATPSPVPTSVGAGSAEPTIDGTPDRGHDDRGRDLGAEGGGDHRGGEGRLDQRSSMPAAEEAAEPGGEESLMCENDGRRSECEPLGEAQEAMTSQQFCAAAMYAGVALGCAAAVVACGGSTYVTIGGTAYPCTLVLAGACNVLPSAAAAYVFAMCGTK